MRTSIFTLTLLLALLGTGGTLHADPPPERADSNASSGKTVRLLTVGNSFSRNATRFLDQLAEAGGHRLVHRPIIVGGASLQLHAGKALSHEQDPNDERGRYANGRSLRQELQAEPWDIVTIQQVSRQSFDVTTFRPFAGQLRDIIRQDAPQAKLMVHQTWAYRIDDPWFTSPDPDSGRPATREAMYHGLSRAYRIIAEELNAGLIPVGDAFHLADSDPRWGYRSDSEFDLQAASFPELPDQSRSLHVGWRWRKQNDGHVLHLDAHHANTAGEFLGACVFYEVLFGTDVRDNPFTPDHLDPEYARFLRETAHRAVLEASR
jgi:hypothetical protein